jgi:hypothetical protein
MSGIRYRLSEAEAQARLDEFASAGSTDLSADLALARFLAEQLAGKSPAPSASILATVARLASAQEAMDFKHGEMLSKAAVMQIAMELIRCVTAEFQGSCEGWEIRLENVSNRFIGVIQAATNTTEPQARIEAK